ncbi:MAG TPA: UDP-N-acetylmuramoyl-tripeptide--D-alanyl-D-alanine ligase [Methylophilaceae bacterium]|nr:UDP-N-acetylmuramoyl-tripeptide--D-alanyl-D-alanine ligase [Methylophilaceae bacterium]
MMMLSEAAAAIGGSLIGADVRFASVGTDSRDIARGQLFVALKGDHFDGHDYLEQAMNQGASAVLVSEDKGVTPAIVVNDTCQALGKLASFWRKKFTAPFVAITGSNGKTTIKEMLVAVLANHAGGAEKIHATVGNLNNHIGLPLTLLKLRAHHRYSVLEMGMSHLGEIAYLADIAKPDVAVISNAGTAHIGEVGSRSNIAQAKGEIFSGLTGDGVAVINADDDYADYWKSLNTNRKIVTFGLNANADVSATFKEKSGACHVQLTTKMGQADFMLNALGTHNVRNALAACAATVALGISIKEIADGLSQFHAVKGRLQRKLGVNHTLVIDDTYNANPDSMRAAIDVLAKLSGKKILVLGDMGELGSDAPRMHAEIGAYAKAADIEVLYCFGELSQAAVNSFGVGARHFSHIDTLIDALLQEMRQGDSVLVKGSRFMKMERVVNAIVIDADNKNQMNEEVH